MSFGKEGEEMGSQQLRACAVPAIQPAADLFSSLACPPFADPGPAADDPRHRFIQHQTMVSGQGDGLVRVPQRDFWFATKLVKDRSECQGVRYAVRLC